METPEVYVFVLGLSSSFPPKGTSDGLFEGTNMENLVPTPPPHSLSSLQNYTKILGFEKTDARDKISIKGIWGMGPKNHHIFYHSRKKHLFSGVLYICVEQTTNYFSKQHNYSLLVNMPNTQMKYSFRNFHLS